MRRLSVLMARFGFVLVAVVFGFSHYGNCDEPPCRQRLIKICDEQDGNAICRLLGQDAPETVESIAEFLRNISHLDSDIQQDLICARLMGQKKILGLKTEVVDDTVSGSYYTFQSADSRWKLEVRDAGYKELVNSLQEVERMKLCPPRDITFDLEGMIRDVEATYSDGSLKRFDITVDGVSFLRIVTALAPGEGGFNDHIRPLKKRLSEEYEKYMNVGLKREPVKAETSRTIAPVKDLETFTNDIGMEFVKIPAGEFGMENQMWSCSGNNRLHQVKISKTFYMGRHEVTQGQWKAVMGNNPSYFKECGPECPVENVSWDDVQKFLDKLNRKGGDYEYCLPTEAQWEYACRAGSTTRYYTGDSESDLARAGWYDGNSGDKTHPVGQKEPNAFGLYDMHGNVWEWCRDWYGDYPPGPVTDPTGPDSGSSRVLRGGCWISYARGCRSAYRDDRYPSYRNSDYGFRLALSPGR